MKPAATAVQSLPVRAPQAPKDLTFPVRGPRPALLRRLRDRLFREGKHDLALEAAQDVARLDPGRESFFRVGFLEREVGRYRDALKTFRDALRFRTGPAYLVPEIHLHIAYTWFLLGKRKRMGQSLRRAYSMRRQPRSAANFHLSLGNFHFARQQYREAFEEYARAEASFPTALGRGLAAHNQGLVLIRLGELPEARRHLERALRVHERAGHRAELAIARVICGALYFDLGQQRRALGMLVRAARAFRVMGKSDREAEALQNAGYVASQLGMSARSRALLSRAIQLGLSTGQWRVQAYAHAARAMNCAQEENFEGAQADLARAQKLLRGRRDWAGTLHVCRAQAGIAALFGEWEEVRRRSLHAERVAKKAGDLPRVAEFRKMRARAEAILGRRRAAVHARKSASRLEALMGRAAPSGETVRKLAVRLARTGLPILVTGESGTGKTELAKTIHAASRRARRPCVVVPCEHLRFPASDLAGHVQGAWSGAHRDSLGLVRHARGGTLVLDRVDELSLPDQHTLLGIAEGRIRPVGGTEEEKIDVRIIATCRDETRLLPELRQRLAGAILQVPPLRERSGEIPGLVEEILAGRRRITCDAVVELVRHRWEGNLPELSGILDRLVAHSKNSIGLKLVRRILTTPESYRVRARVDKKRHLLQMAAALA